MRQVPSTFILLFNWQHFGDWHSTKVALALLEHGGSLGRLGEMLILLGDCPNFGTKITGDILIIPHGTCA